MNPSWMLKMRGSSTSYALFVMQFFFLKIRVAMSISAQKSIMVQDCGFEFAHIVLVRVFGPNFLKKTVFYFLTLSVGRIFFTIRVCIVYVRASLRILPYSSSPLGQSCFRVP